MATHSSILAWGIPWTGEPGGLQSVGSQRGEHDCRRRNETPTLQSGLNLYILTLASYSCFILYPLHNNLQGKLPSTTIQRLYSAQAQGEITFTLAYLLQLRLCFGELSYQLRIHFVPRSVPFEESEKHPCVQEMFFSHGNKQRILS